jgi:hypothetical protein
MGVLGVVGGTVDVGDAAVVGGTVEVGAAVVDGDVDVGDVSAVGSLALRLSSTPPPTRRSTITAIPANTAAGRPHVRRRAVWSCSWGVLSLVIVDLLASITAKTAANSSGVGSRTGSGFIALMRSLSS